MLQVRSKLEKACKAFEKPYTTLNHIELSRDALVHNCKCMKKLHNGNELFPVLKSNAYGHGLLEIVQALEDFNFPYVCVDGYYEALQIRSVSRQRVLVMGHILPENVPHIHTEGFAFVVHDKEVIKAFGSVGREIAIHLEINTGMNRYGIQPEELDEYLRLINSFPNLRLEGIMSHLADADGETNEYTEFQQEIFDTCLAKVLAAGESPRYIHLAQTAGSAKTSSRFANAIRLGIGLYGINPLAPSDAKYTELDHLQPVLALHAKVTKVITLQSGEKVSYNCTFTATRPTRIGVLALGYYEGIDRSLSNQGVVKFQDTYLPVIGRVCMNHMMIDLTGSSAGYGDNIVVISRDKQDKNSIQNLSRDHDLFSYLMITRLNENIRRKIV